MSLNNQPFIASDKANHHIKESIIDSIFNTLLNNRIPLAVADKLSRQVGNGLDLELLYEMVAKDIQAQRFPKQRILDRTIVHMFELLFRLINSQKSDEDNNISAHSEFFSLVPRGECLDLFLQLVKEYCMGDEEIKRYTYEIEPLIENYSEQGIIQWEQLYQSKDFKKYLSGLLNLILTHLREDKKPIPALENKIPMQYRPYRINSFLTKICQLKQMGAIQLDT